MGKASFLSFFMVLAEISSGVKEFFRNDGGHDAHGVLAKEDGSPAAPAVAGPSFKAYSKETTVYLHLSERHLRATSSPLDSLKLKDTSPLEEEMSRPPLEVADLIRAAGAAFL